MKPFAGSKLMSVILCAGFTIVFTIGNFVAYLPAFAQAVPGQVDVEVNREDTGWYAQPWAWVIGVALFIIVIVAITRGNRRA